MCFFHPAHELNCMLQLFFLEKYLSLRCIFLVINNCEKMFTFKCQFLYFYKCIFLLMLIMKYKTVHQKYVTLANYQFLFSC